MRRNRKPRKGDTVKLYCPDWPVHGKIGKVIGQFCKSKWEISFPDGCFTIVKRRDMRFVEVQDA